MSRIPFVCASTFLILALAPHGAALHCNGDIVAVSAGGETLYIDDREDHGIYTNQWIYLETNGIEGLQSGGGSAFEPDDCGVFFPCLPAERCVHPDPDALII